MSGWKCQLFWLVSCQLHTSYLNWENVGHSLLSYWKLFFHIIYFWSQFFLLHLLSESLSLPHPSYTIFFSFVSLGSKWAKRLKLKLKFKKKKKDWVNRSGGQRKNTGDTYTEKGTHTIFLVDALLWGVPDLYGQCPPMLVILDAVSRQPEQASKQCSSTASASVSASMFLPQVSAMMFLCDRVWPEVWKVKLTLSSPSCFLSWCFIRGTETLMRQ